VNDKRKSAQWVVELANDAMAMNRLLIAVGTLFLVAGVLWPLLKRMQLFHLPGDVVIDRPGFKFMFPLTTMLILSAVLSLLVWLLRR
jgi:hypothetical protein